MKYLKQYILSAIVKILGKQRVKSLIPAIAGLAGLDLLMVAYNNIGILKFENAMVSGEYYLIHKILKKNLSSIKKPIIFDVGANIGDYSLMLSREFPNAEIYAFEPNKNTYEILAQKTKGAVRCINAGLGDEAKKEKIYTYSDNLTSSHASIYGGVFHSVRKTDEVSAIEFQMATLDQFCEKEGIYEIDFLKIDTEGNEFSVLKGACKKLSEAKIKIIQFEFGECDVFSRIFLADFYEILSDYNIFRLDSERLIPLFEYNHANEIFCFQNFVAARKDFPLTID